MKLKNLPVKLDGEVSEAWTEFVLQPWMDNPQKARTNFHEQLAREVWRQEQVEDEPGDPGADELRTYVNRCRSPLSRFFRGDGSEIYNWLQPNHYGEALCAVRGTSIEALRYHLSRLLDTPEEDRPIALEDLVFFPLRLRVRCSNVGLLAADWVERLQQSDEISWPDFREVVANRPRPGVGIDIQTGRNVRRGSAGIENALIEHLVQFEFGSSPSARQRITVEVRPLPVSETQMDQWLRMLVHRGRLEEEQARILREVGVSGLHALHTPEELVRALSDIIDGHLEDLDPVALIRRRAEWVRIQASSSATPRAQVWLTGAEKLIEAWFNESKSLETSLDRQVVFELLGNTPENVPDEDVLEALALFGDDETSRSETLRRLLAKYPPSLVKDLRESELLCGDAQGALQLSKSLRALGVLALPFSLTPAELGEAWCLGGNFQLFVNAVCVARPEALAEWVQAALAIDRLDQPLPMLAVLHGLSERADDAEALPDDLLQRLWASTVWACVMGLNWNAVGSDMLGPDWTTTLQRVSERFRKRLPTLAEPTPVQDLLGFVDAATLEATQAWRPRRQRRKTKTRESALRRDWAEIELLFELAPFQVAFDVALRLQPWFPKLPLELVKSPRLELHHAGRDDLDAQRALLLGRSERSTSRENFSEAQHVLWACALDATHRGLTDEIVKGGLLRSCHEHDPALEESLRKFIETRPDLVPPEVKDALRILDNFEHSGPEGWETQLLQAWHTPSHDGVDFDELLLKIASLLGRVDALVALADAAPSGPSFFAVSRVSVERPHSPPTLSFPNLDQLEGLRNGALVRLAELGEPQHLKTRISSRCGLTVTSPLIGTARGDFALLREKTRMGTPSAPPTDAAWSALMQSMSHHFGEGWWQFVAARGPEIAPQTAYLNMIRDAPSEHRWLLLAHIVPRVWRTRHDATADPFWNELRGTAGARFDANTWTASADVGQLLDEQERLDDEAPNEGSASKADPIDSDLTRESEQLKEPLPFAELHEPLTTYCGLLNLARELRSPGAPVRENARRTLSDLLRSRPEFEDGSFTLFLDLAIEEQLPEAEISEHVMNRTPVDGPADDLRRQVAMLVHTATRLRSPRSRSDLLERAEQLASQIRGRG